LAKESVVVLVDQDALASVWVKEFVQPVERQAVPVSTSVKVYVAASVRLVAQVHPLKMR
jgi:hypothetical protein